MMRVPLYLPTSATFTAHDDADAVERDRQRRQIQAFTQHVLYYDDYQVVVDWHGFDVLDVPEGHRHFVPDIYDGRVWKVRNPPLGWTLAEAIEVESSHDDVVEYQICYRRLRHTRMD